MSMKNSEVVVVARNFMKKICVENIRIYIRIPSKWNMYGRLVYMGIEKKNSLKRDV